MAGATESIVMEVSPEKIYEIVTDFENYSEFLPEMRQVEVLKKSATAAQARFTIKIIKTVQYTLDYKLTPNEKVSWSFVEGNLFKDCKGSWRFEELEAGVTEATYNVDIDFGRFVPKMITDKLAGSNLPSMMKQFKDRAESL